MCGLEGFNHDPTDTKQHYKEKLKEQTEKIRELKNLDWLTYFKIEDKLAIEKEPEEYWIFEKILKERKRQDKKWGKQNHHPLYWLAILTEEIGEANKEIVKYISSNEVDKFRLQYYEKELIHSAVVIFAAIDSLRRNELKEEVK